MSLSRFSSFTLSTTVQKNLKAKKSACVFCLRLGLDPGGKWVRFVVLDGQRLDGGGTGSRKRQSQRRGQLESRGGELEGQLVTSRIGDIGMAQNVE